MRRGHSVLSQQLHNNDARRPKAYFYRIAILYAGPILVKRFTVAGRSLLLNGRFLDYS